MAFVLSTPRNLAEALKLLGTGSDGATAVLAGGTDLLLDIDEARADPQVVVSLRRLRWQTHTWKGDQLTIGSTLPLRALELDPRVKAEVPGLWTAVRAVGSVALRHRATMGGNLGRASPASDLIPMLLAFDARVVLVGQDSDRELPVAEFVRGPRETALQAGELIRAIVVPHPGPSDYVWQRVRAANDISQVGVAVAWAREPPFWRIALGGIWPAPKRVPEAELMLTSYQPSELEIEFAAQEAARVAPFVTDKRASETYRRRLVTTLTRRAIRATMTGLTAIRTPKRKGDRR